nr:hypothetical protein [Tanacetum cinerariifolium]
MSDASSAVIYTSVYTDSEPWRYYGEDSAETGPLRVIVYGYDGLPMQPVAPPSPDYVPGPEHPPSPDYVPGPEHSPSPVEIPYVPELKYPEYLEPSDDEAPLEDQPLPADASPIVASPDYVADSNLEEDLEEDPEDDQADHPVDGGDGDDEPFNDDDDDDDDTYSDSNEDLEEEPFKEEGEHLASADLLLYRLIDIFEADMPPWKRASLTTPALGFEVGESSAAGAARQPRPIESDLRRYRVEQASYGITHSWDEIVDTLMEIAPTTLEGVDQRVTELDTTVRQRTDEFEIRFEEAQDDRALLRVRVNTFFRDRPDHRRTAMLIDREAMYVRESWAGSKDRSLAITAHVKTLEAQVAALSAQTSLPLPIQPVAPPSPDYVPGPEHPLSPDYVPGPEHLPSPVEIHYVPEPEYPEYLAPSDDEDPEEGPKDDQADYPIDRGDGDDEPSDDDDTNDEDPEEEPLRRMTRRRRSTQLRPTLLLHAALPSPPLLVPSLPLPLPSPLTTSPTDTGAPLGYRAAEIRMRALLSSTSCRTDIPEADMPPRKRVCLTTLALRFEIGESFVAGAARQPGPTESDLRRCRVEQAGYGTTDAWNEIVDKQRTNEFEIYFEEAQDDRSLLRARVNTLFRDRPDHRRTTMLMDREAMYAREAWAFSMDMSSTIAAHVKTLETQVVALIAQTSSLQTQLTTTLGCIKILEARDPDPQEGPAEAGSNCLSCMVINKMAPKKRTTRATPATATTPTTTITNAQLHALIDRGVVAALAERDADRSRNGYKSNDSGTGGRRQMNTP